jgi:2-polyprenyl-3-methyl-5-hydroxy-6-metoxy-1,4-benzoquinol methylase
MRSEAILELVRGPVVLDVGCTDHTVKLGKPQWVHGRLRERFDDVHGVDINGENLAAMRGEGFDNLYEQSAEDLDLGIKFDTIVAGEVIEHLANPGKFLAAARDHLAPDGRIVLSTPYAFSLQYFAYAFAKYPKTCQNDQHTMWFCPETMSELVERVGLRIDQLDLVDDYDYDDPSRLYRWSAKVLRVLGPILPDRLHKNAMVMVLVPEG